jgi:hypothetical protein
VETDPGPTPAGSGEGSSGNRPKHATDPLQEALARTWWGERPWQRYVRLLPLVAPALVIDRVAAVTNFSRANAWPVLVSLDLGNWLQIVTGSFVAWFPWSLACVATAVTTFAVWAAVQTGYGTTIIELERRQPVMIVTIRDYALMLAAFAVPLLVIFALIGPLPRPFLVLPAAGAAGAWLLVSEQLPDEYRLAVIEHIRQKRAEGRATLVDIFQAYAANLHVRFPPKWRQILVSLLVLVASAGVVFGLWRMLTDRTPWVPQECIVYSAKCQQSSFNGYLLIEGYQTDVVLRASDRVVLSLPATLVSTKSTC